MLPAQDNPILVWTAEGLYCPQGRFYIDPKRSVEHALITHAHSDHARRGSRRYTCVDQGLDLLKVRLGSSIQVQGVAYGEELFFNGLKVSFHSAGHILGSAQVRIQRENEVWVVSGDYKRDLDPSCDPFELVPCDTLISEATFGTPQYQWAKDPQHGRSIFDWWQANTQQNQISVIFAYSLGKAQRVLAELYLF
jgi:putative mRNA 3-end processing factor